MNPDLAVAGFCTVFDEPSVDGRPAERRADFEWFPAFFDELPLRVDHHLIVTSSGAYNAGKVSRFAIVDGAHPIPSGVCAWPSATTTASGEAFSKRWPVATCGRSVSAATVRRRSR